MRFPTMSNANWPIQSQKMARDWKNLIEKVEELYYPCSENTDSDQLCGYHGTDLCLWFCIYADSSFSHEVAQIYCLLLKIILSIQNE